MYCILLWWSCPRSRDSSGSQAKWRLMLSRLVVAEGRRPRTSVAKHHCHKPAIADSPAAAISIVFSLQSSVFSQAVFSQAVFSQTVFSWQSSVKQSPVKTVGSLTITTIKPSSHPTVKPSNNQAIQPSNHPTIHILSTNQLIVNKRQYANQFLNLIFNFVSLNKNNLE